MTWHWSGDHDWDDGYNQAWWCPVCWLGWILRKLGCC